MEFEQIYKKVRNYQLAYYIQAAEKLEIQWKIIIPSLLVEFSKNGKTWRQLKSISPLNDAVSSNLSNYKNTCSNLLKTFGFKVPRQRDVTTLEEILKFKKENNIENIVIKPTRGFGGHGVTILPKTKEEILNGLNLALENSLSKKKDKVVVEEFVKGNNYRLLVLKDKVIAAVLREPAKVIGDGKSNTRLLINDKNVDMKRLGLSEIQMDIETQKVLQSQNLTMDSIPENGKTVYLRINANLTSGGTTTECLSKVNKYYKKIAIEATKTLGLLLAGVDLITPDITNPNSGYFINEVNHNPGLRPHYLPDKGTPADVAYEIQKYILEKYKNES